MSRGAAQTDPISDAYAKALFDLAREQNALAEVEQEIEQVVQLLEEHGQLSAIFAHPAIDAQDRARTIEKLFKGRVSTTTLHFLLILNRKGRLGYLRAIRAAFDRLAKAHRGEVDVEVHTARPLNPAQFDQVAARVSKFIGKKAVLHPHVDAKLIGGLKVRIADRLIDASVAAQLRKLGRQLESAGHEAVRQAADKILV
ncbi:MAG TPA: ATP synthase F1 subunit delta [Sphingomicrobium sp.]|nr:ATP synthase F1 subunit delta [Sphingomicrobium sp.]